MITVANPIYDIVFKYLMEDERIARTILSALLQKDIIRVEVRPHEYSNNKHAKTPRTSRCFTLTTVCILTMM